MDVFTRGIRGWHLGRGLGHTLSWTYLERRAAEEGTLDKLTTLRGEAGSD